jgi:hypothetical protein
MHVSARRDIDSVLTIMKVEISNLLKHENPNRSSCSQSLYRLRCTDWHFFSYQPIHNVRVKGKVVSVLHKHRAMRSWVITLLTLLTSAPDGDKRSSSRLVRFTSTESTPGTNSIGNCVHCYRKYGCRRKEKTLWSCWEPNLDFPVVHLVAYSEY